MPVEYDQLLSTSITTSASIVSSPISLDGGNPLSLALEAIFTYGSTAGTTVKAYIQSTLDAGTTWFDVACFAFATTTASKLAQLVSTVAVTTAPAPSDGSLADNTVRSGGPLGDRLRAKVLVDGTYTTTGAGTTLAIHAVKRSP